MSMSVAQRIIRTIKELNDITKEINLTDRLEADLKIDSLEAVEIILELEDEFDIRIADDVIFITVQDFVSHIESLL